MSHIARRGIAVLSLFLLAFSLSAKKSKDHSEPKKDEGPAARLSEAPASARSLENPFSGSKEAVAAGRKLFLRHCAECHGRDGGGVGRAADFHSSAIQSAPPGVIFWAIRNGRLRKGMPSWSGLPDQQLWQIVTYLKTLK